ncbi:MAG: DeoR/GlpR family DNA-binding transcription regulator [Desulfobacterales bacterium]|nr:DeoR/GlpR family DNA-binding transcription regulator [Desulfobacterales bacterium]
MNHRQEKIVQLVRETGFATVEEMARVFNVTPQTIRRDINTLDREGKIARYHGGAAPSGSAENVAYTRRQTLLREEKKEIAKAVADLVPDNSSLFINIGTTTEQVARALIRHHKLKVITNNLNIAAIMGRKEDFQVMVSGGIVRARDNGITGDSAIQFIRQFKADIGIIGISGIDEDGTLLDFDFMEVNVARAIIDNARKVFLVADHSKFRRNAMVKLGNLSEIHTLITDQPPPGPVMDLIKQEGINLVIPQ